MLLCASFANAQDLIQLKSGKTEEVQILEINKEKIKFKKQVIPGDQLVMKAHIVNIVKKNFGKLHADAYVEDKLAATADFIFALKKPENSAN